MIKNLLSRTLPTFSLLGEPLSDRSRTVKDWLRWLGRNLWQIGMRADSDHIFLFAAGIAFNILIALVPMVLILLFVLGYLLEPDEVAIQLNLYLDRFLIASEFQHAIIEMVRTQITSLVANRGIAGAIGIVGLLWTSSALASSIRLGVNRILRCREEKSYFIYKLYDFLTIIMIGLLVFISVLIGPILQVISSINTKIVEMIPIVNLDWVLAEGVTFALALILFYVVFRFTPYQRQQQAIVWAGTLTSALLWEAARLLFQFYVSEFRAFSQIYGAYAFIAATAFWIYYTALIFLVGSEVAYHFKQSKWNARRMFHRITRNGAVKQ